MSKFDEQDNIEFLENKTGSKGLPITWVVLFLALIVWGIYYFIEYTPAISGWTQDKEFSESIKVK